MSLEIQKQVITINNTGIPGFSKNGLFIGESPIEPNIIFRTLSFAANQTKSFTLNDFYFIPLTLFVVDAVAMPSYRFDVVTTSELAWSMTIDASKLTSFVGSKIFTFPFQVIEKGSRINILSSQANSGLIIFGKRAYIEETKVF